ncbi:PIN domain-containing protein [Albimonas sp. CAU 1670]|uniref:PIN domain-containing protein n=1 Tax=Albimonas sp. CAU 1670 TaxID=3032599 RepID=UPI0023DA0781|nr:PIN domain-containing protein [Albimonas sp. CAU 1670]MDF2231902.1 PIN domain-containing protein [Albimonas sp. CAU 1670]
MAPRVFLDANVLYPQLVRGCLLSAAVEGLIVPCWSPGVVGEWAHTALRQHGPQAEAEVRAEAASMAARWPDGLAEAAPGEGPLIGERTGAEAGPGPGLTLPDAGDVHVLSAALAAGAGFLATFNLRDFPPRKLRDLGVAAIHPDALLWEIAGREPEAMARALTRALGPFPKLAASAQEAAGGLKRARLPRLAKMVKRGEIGPGA